MLKYDHPSVCMGLESHSVTLVGYGHDGSDKYYIVQNSYGLDWGYRGYCKIWRDPVKDFYVPVHTKSLVTVLVQHQVRKNFSLSLSIYTPYIL